MTRDLSDIIYYCAKAFDALEKTRSLIDEKEETAQKLSFVIEEYMDEINKLTLEIKEQLHE